MMKTLTILLSLCVALTFTACDSPSENAAEKIEDVKEAQEMSEGATEASAEATTDSGLTDTVATAVTTGT